MGWLIISTHIQNKRQNLDSPGTYSHWFHNRWHQHPYKQTQNTVDKNNIDANLTHRYTHAANIFHVYLNVRGQEIIGEKSVVSFSHANIQEATLVFLSSLLFSRDLVFFLFVCLFFAFLLKSLILTLYFHGLTSNSVLWQFCIISYVLKWYLLSFYATG